jgi:hypothetical protein
MKQDKIGCLQLIGLLIIIGVVSYFFVKLIPIRQPSEEDLCKQGGGIPLFKEETKYRGFPPGAWQEKVFYKCEKLIN